MCQFCNRAECHLTKEQVLARGPILERNARDAMRVETEVHPQTYCFDGVPAYYSLSALIPDTDDENPHAFKRFVFDEDEGCADPDDWEYCEILKPLAWPQEADFFKKQSICKKGKDRDEA